ncbi:putative 4-hydroxybenzoate polyprenyl transferase [Apodospora peruviana]|uniref:Diterpenoid pyrone biosynthesis cluster protein C n=1 Tax=Apodospora peruviana TaxID=516989 RepID=A0AAE0I0N7_9PEZI|nr:putative 4-hydroxybenzoate polyprenyl transferase [Apodospora peruviana]
MASAQEKTPLTSESSPNKFNFFPHLPPYSPPTTGILSKLPPSWVPYAQLMRLDRPAGFYVFYLSHVIGLFYAACITTPPPSEVARLTVLLIPVNVLLRGAACSFNDTVDQAFDRRVARCRHRPVARGAVTTTQAHIFTACQLLFGYIPLLVLSGFPRESLPHAAGMVTLLFAYAFMKRGTNYPQVVLGVSLAWAIFFCGAALGLDPFDFSSHGKSTLALFGSNVVWSITYDTIYAHQDVVDDVKAGVMSMAVRFRESTKLLAAILSVIQVVLLVACGIYERETFGGFIYFVGTVGGVAATMAYFIYEVDLKSPGSCGRYFHRQGKIVGAAFLSGLIGEYVVKVVR